MSYFIHIQHLNNLQGAGHKKPTCSYSKPLKKISVQGKKLFDVEIQMLIKHDILWKCVYGFGVSVLFWLTIIQLTVVE